MAGLCGLGVVWVLGAAWVSAGPVAAWPARILGLQWDPAAGQLGLGALLVNTLVVAGISGPLAGVGGVCIAGWLSFARRSWLARLGRQLTAILACAPTVVLGWVGLSVLSPEGPALFTGALVLAMMALPTVVALAERALAAVPSETLVAAYAVGADRWTTLWRVAVPSARRGLVAAALLGFARVLGEAVVAVLACGDRVGLPSDPSEPARTLAAHVVLAFGGGDAGSATDQGVMLAALLLGAICLPFAALAAWLGPPDAEAL